MKKLLLLFLLVAGGVSTANAKTIYFANNFSNINSLKLYLYTNEGETVNAVFPGVDFPSAESYTIDGFSVYKLNLGNYEKFIITFKFDDNSSWIRESQPANTSAYKDNDYIDFTSSWTDNKVALTSALNVYDYSFTATASTGLVFSNIYLYQDEEINGSWPGGSLVVSDNTYSYTHKSFKPNIGTVIFNNGNDTHQTGNLWATPGTNNYFIASVTATKNGDTYGQGVKTNGSGYATTISYSPLTIPSGIAYFATDDGNGSATAHALTNPGSGVPMLVKGNANTIYAFAAAGSGSDDTTENAFLQGPEANLGSNEGGGYNYILNGDAFYLANGKWVDSEKAYLKLSVQASSARVLKFADDEGIQGISAVSDAKATDGAYYNLSGQRINAPARGLYIQNGKKMIVK